VADLTETPNPAPSARAISRSFRGFGWSDKIYRTILRAAALVTVLLIVAIAVELYLASTEAQKTFGWGFVTSSEWNPVTQKFGALPFIVGTLYTSFVALLIAIPIGVGTAVFLSELAPRWLRDPISFLVELLASVPSVIYGLWGVFILCPWLAAHVETPISKSPLGKWPIFDAAPNGNDILSAAIILAIMVLPFITAVSRDILRAVPKATREGSYALGATQWETIKGIVLPYGRSGIIGAIVLGLGRALGETMAVTMVIGNNPSIHLPLFSPGYTMSSIIANEFNEASFSLYRSSLIEIALILFAISMIVNSLARVLIYYSSRSMRGSTT
jgi:phosphate transport system permease protein